MIFIALGGPRPMMATRNDSARPLQLPTLD